MKHCDKCTTWYLSPRPVVADIGKIYPPEYGNFHTAPPVTKGMLKAVSDLISVRAISNRRQQERYRELVNQFTALKPNDEARILDVGCGDGHCLDLLKAVLPNAHTVGIEVDAGAAARAAERHTIHTGLFEDVVLKEKFDLIVSSHVIEHVASPADFLVNIRERLARKGIAIIDTPNVDTPLFHSLRRDWGGIHAPRHWTLFDGKTITDLAHRCGMKVVDIAYMPINVFWIWSAHSLLNDRFPKLADLFFHPQKCTAAFSVYYTSLLTMFQMFERAVGATGKKFGQMRVVLEAAN